MIAFTTILFSIVAPLCTFGMLFLKGLPHFTAGHALDVVIWIYQVTWIPSLISGLLLSAVFYGIRPWRSYFIQPYDFGRCFSLGAIVGAITEASTTWGYRMILHRPFSGFWIAGEMIAGFLVGATLSVIVLGR